MMLHILPSLILLLVEIRFDQVDVLLGNVARLSELLNLHLDSLELDPVVADRVLELLALILSLELQEGSLLVDEWSLLDLLLGPRVVGGGTLVVRGIDISLTWWVVFESLSLSDLGLLLLGQLDLVHRSRLSGSNSKPKGTLVLGLADSIVTNRVVPLESIFLRAHGLLTKDVLSLEEVLAILGQLAIAVPHLGEELLHLSERGDLFDLISVPFQK